MQLAERGNNGAHEKQRHIGKFRNISVLIDENVLPLSCPDKSEIFPVNTFVPFPFLFHLSVSYISPHISTPPSPHAV
jgi:hypothetical protein